MRYNGLTLMNNAFTPQNPLFLPNNEVEMASFEQHVKNVLHSTLDINLTAKKANKLRDVAFAFAGFPNGYQQMMTYVSDKSPPSTIYPEYLLSIDKIGLSQVEQIKSVVNKKKGLFIVSSENGHGKTFTTTRMARFLMEQHSPESDFKKSATEGGFSELMRKTMRRTPEWIHVSDIKHHDLDRVIALVEEGVFVICGFYSTEMHTGKVYEQLRGMSSSANRFDDALSGVLVQRLMNSSVTASKSPSSKLMTSAFSDAKELIKGGRNGSKSVFVDATSKYQLNLVSRESMINTYGKLFSRWEEVTSS